MNAQLKHVPNALNHRGIILTSEYITPATAADWLQKNKCNRPIRRQVVAAYVSDMMARRWEERTPNIICFLPDGMLGNAQHTLTSIVESGVSLWMLVARNVPMEAIAHMDRGLGRTVTDISRFLGLDFESRRGTIAMACDLGLGGIKGAGGHRRSFDLQYQTYLKHKEVVDFAFELAPRKKQVGLNTTILGVIARAAYGYPNERLAKFLEIVDKGVCAVASDQAAMRYRDWCLTHGSSGTKGASEIYRRGQSALKHFLEGNPITKLYGVNEEIFPLP